MSRILEPLGDYILARQVDAKDQSEGGIIIPDQAKQKPKEAEILAVGPGKRLETGELIPMLVEVGDMVVFASYAGQEIELDDEPFLLLRQDEILARIQKN